MQYRKLFFSIQKLLFNTYLPFYAKNVIVNYQQYTTCHKFVCFFQKM